MDLRREENLRRKCTLPPEAIKIITLHCFSNISAVVFGAFYTLVRPTNFLSDEFTVATFVNPQDGKLVQFITLHLSIPSLVYETRILINPFCLLLVGAVHFSVGGRCKEISKCSNQVLPQSYQQQSWRPARVPKYCNNAAWLSSCLAA
jgi:hypothetical protein